MLDGHRTCLDLNPVVIAQVLMNLWVCVFSGTIVLCNTRGSVLSQHGLGGLGGCKPAVWYSQHAAAAHVSVLNARTASESHQQNARRAVRDMPKLPVRLVVYASLSTP